MTLTFRMVRSNNGIAQEKQYFYTLEAAQAEARRQAREMGFTALLKWSRSVDASNWIAFVPNSAGTNWTIDLVERIIA